MALTSNDMVTWLGSRQNSPTPDPDAIKLLQFLDNAAIGIKMALEKSSNPKGKRLLNDNAKACSRRQTMGGGTDVSNANMPETAREKRRKLKARQDADESFNSLFNIEPLINSTKQQNDMKMSTKNNKQSKLPKKSLLNRDLPVSFFVEPALRGRREISTDLNVGFSYQSFNTDCNISPQSIDSHDSRSRSPSLPEDTLESILDQGEINHLLSINRWPHDVGAGSGVYSVKSDSSTTSSWVTGVDLTTPSPQTCSESSLDSFYSTAPPMTMEWFQGVDLSSPPTYSPDPCLYTLRNLASFESRMSPFQFYGYKYGHDNNFDDTALVPRYQTQYEWDGRSTNNCNNAIHAAHYFNVRIAPNPPSAIHQGFT